MWSWTGAMAVSIGAALGACLRWGLGMLLNPVWPTIPLGTLAANLMGGLLMGVAMELMARATTMSPELRLMVTTGFLGGLTTFSTFSAEMSGLLLRGDVFWGAVGIAVHVMGSIALTVTGIFLVRLLASAMMA